MESQSRHSETGHVHDDLKATGHFGGKTQPLMSKSQHILTLEERQKTGGERPDPAMETPIEEIRIEDSESLADFLSYRSHTRCSKRPDQGTYKLRFAFLAQFALLLTCVGFQLGFICSTPLRKLFKNLPA
jgi:hypothetical protein